MVRIFDGKNVDKLSNLVYRIFRLQEFFTHITEVNPPTSKPCLYAMWHAHQCCVHGIPDKNKVNVLVSRSRDGQIIADVVEKWGFKTIRGSKGKQGAVEASMQMITALKSDESCAMMVDGPKGPVKVVKGGVVKIAKLSGAPIVPVYWYSPFINFLKFPSWDEFRIPFFFVNLINLYGEPIYVKEDDDEELVRQQVQKSLEELEAKAPKTFREVYKFYLWKKKQK